VAVVGGIYDELKEKFIAASQTMKLGYGLDKTVEMGPLSTRQGQENVERFIERGIKEGAKMVLDGRGVKVPGYEKGYFLAPTIFEEVDPAMEVAKEEAFGPLANLMRADNLDQVIQWINSSNYGHSACIVTKNGIAARKFIREVEVGNVGVNAGIPQPYAFFGLGSKKDSFFGSAKSRMDSINLFLDDKTVTLRWV
jgi:malonate-semialdehyde dehydrogenase (acetylating)/methylmalonate-semialdehyde dehydrogenase